jgi:hypothetical protein
MLDKNLRLVIRKIGRVRLGGKAVAEMIAQLAR